MDVNIRIEYFHFFQERVSLQKRGPGDGRHDQKPDHPTWYLTTHGLETGLESIQLDSSTV